MASATDPSRSEPGDAGMEDAAAIRRVLPRFNLLLDTVIVIAVALTSFVFLNRPLDTQGLVIIGAGDRGIATGFHGAEISQADGRPFRWTTAEATVRLPAHGTTDHLLALRLAAPTGAASSTSQPVVIELNRTSLATLSVPPAPRVYRLLAPRHRIAIAGNDITLRTTTTRVPGDRRDPGVVAFAVTFAALDETAWLPPVQTAAIGSAALLLLIALRMLAIGALRWIIVALFAAISLSMRHSDLRFAHRWEALLLTIGLTVTFALCTVVIMWWTRRRNASSAHDTYPSLSQATPQTVPASALPSPPFYHSRTAFYLLLTTFAAILAILLLMPLVPEPTRSIPGPPGDNLEYVWKLQWFADALAQRQSPTFVPHLFYPTGYELAYSELTPAHTLLGLPLTLLAGPTLTYNALIVVSFVLTTCFTALLAERSGAGRLGAWVAGIGVGFCLWRYHHTLGHMPLFGTQWVVLALYGLEGFIRRRSAFDAALTGTGVALAAWSSWYYGPTLWLLMALWLLMRWSWKETHTLRTAGPAALAAPLVALALIAPYAQPTVQALRGGDTRHEYTSLLSLSARPLDYLTPSRYHALWGAWSAQIAPATAGERLVAPGFALLALAGVGAWRWRRSTITWTLLTIAGVCFVMSLGPELRLDDRTIPLPALLAYEHIPVLRSIRAWSRMAFYVQICIGLLASLSLTGFVHQPRVWRVAGLVMVCAVILETLYLTPWSTSTLPRPVDRWLAAQPGSGATLQVPDSFSGPVEYYTLFSQRPSLTGYGTFLPASATTVDMAWMHEFPFPRALTTIRLLGGEYVLVRRSAMDRVWPGWRERAAQRPELTQVYEDDEFTVYRIMTGWQP